MKRFVAVAVLMLVAVSLQAQSWAYFFNPRPHLEVIQSEYYGLPKAATLVEWQFHPTLQLSATQIRPGLNGNTTQAKFFSAVGPAITLQKTTYADDGTNYAQFSINASLLLNGITPNEAPVFTPQLALMAGVLNNTLNFGPGYSFVDRQDGYSRWCLFISIGINLTNN